MKEIMAIEKELKVPAVRTILGTYSYKDYADLLNVLAHKEFLSIHEAVVYFGVGTNFMYELVNRPDADFVVPNGRQRLIARDKFKEYMMAGKLKERNKAE